jgi:transposase
LENRNKHKIKFLPPYSPFLNPVEEGFSKLKNFVKKHPLDDQETLCERIKDGSYEITKMDCEGWVRHAIDFHNKCINMETNI